MDTAPGPESAGRSPDGKPYPGSCLPDVHSILICCCAVLKPGDKDYEKYKDMDGKLGWIEVSDALFVTFDSCRTEAMCCLHRTSQRG